MAKNKRGDIVLGVQIIGGIYAAALILIAAMGLLIIFGNMGIINLAHGEFLMVGAYVLWLTYQQLKIPFAISLAIAFASTALLGALIEFAVMNKFHDKVEETLLVTYSLSIIMKEMAKKIFGTLTKRVDSPFGDLRLDLGFTVIPAYNLFVVFMALFFVVITWLLFYKTNVGKKMRAIKQNRKMAECIGIDTRKTDLISFAFGTGLSGLAGAVIAVSAVVSTSMGSGYMIDGICTVVMGGLDSLVGTAISATIIGESTNILGGYISQVLAKVIVLFGIVIILRFRPQGLFSKESR